jgi:hypothetical protein
MKSEVYESDTLLESLIEAEEFFDSIKKSYPAGARVWGFLTESGTIYAVVQNQDGIVAVRSTDKSEVHGKLVLSLQGYHLCKNITLGSIRKGDRATIEGYCLTYDRVVRISTSPLVHMLY